MADELVVKDRNTQLRSRSLAAVGFRTVATNCIVAVNNTFAVLPNSTKQVKSIVRHESATVKSGREQLGQTFNTWLPLVLHAVLSDSRLKILMQSLDVSNHTSTSNQALLSKFGSLAVIT